MLQHLGKDQASFLLNDLQCVLPGDGVFVPEALRPVGVLLRALIRPQVRPGHQGVGHGGQLVLQPGGQHCKAHDLDQADILLLDMVEFGVGVVQAQRVLLGGQVIAQHQIQFKLPVPHPGDGGDGVVGDAVGLGQDHRRLVGVAPPGDQDPVGQFHQPLRLGRADPDHRHGPLDNAYLDVLKAGEGHRGLHGGLLHGEGIAAALEVVVGQNGAAYDGQIGVGAHEVMGELPHKVQQLSKTGPVDLHGSVDAVQADAVLIVVDIGEYCMNQGEPLMVMGTMRWFCRAGWFTRLKHSPHSRHTGRTGGSWRPSRFRAAAMALGSFSGLDRLMVMSSSPYSVETFHCISRAMRSRRI